MNDEKQPKLSPTTSNSLAEDDSKTEESCGFEIGCGACKSKRLIIPFCQRFTTPRWALAFVSFGAIVQGFLVNGHTPAVISTLEKRFELTSTESGLITSCYDIAGSLTILFVAYKGSHGHKPLWIGWGMFLIGASCLIFSLPHFIAPRYALSIVFNVCGNAETETCSISLLKNFRFVFYAAMLICGAGASPLYSLTITYLDENVKQRYSSLYNAIFIAFSIFGPGIGFLVGSAFLRVYAYPNETVSISESNDLWVGAWWIGPLIFGIIGIISSFPVLMLPRVLPGTERHRLERKDEIHHTAAEDVDNAHFGRRFRDFPKSLLTLLSNPPFVFLSLGVAVDSLLLGGMTTFGAKYVETQFGLDASDAGITFGLLAILGGAGGQLVGGGLMSKYDVKVKTMLHISYTAPLLSVVCCLSYLITCSNKAFSGVTTSYHDSASTDVAGITSQCNQHCGCSGGVYSPVCGSDGITYFSSCFAGCSDQQIGDVYTNCTCIAATRSGPPYDLSLPATATGGACSDERCSRGWEIILFCLSNFVLVFLTFFNEASVLQASLRSVGFYRRSFAIGIQTLFVRILGTIPGPLVVGALFDRACIQWSVECGAKGSCLSYSHQNLSLYIFLFILVGKILDFAIFLLAFFTYKRAPDVVPELDVLEEEVRTGSAERIDDTSNTEGVSQRPIPLHNRLLPEEVLTKTATDSDGYFINKAFSMDSLSENEATK